MMTRPTPRQLRAAMLAAAICWLPKIGSAQATAPISAGAWSQEIAGGIALGHVYRFEDTTFGNRPNVMVSAGMRHRNGLGVDVEFDRTLGLTPSAAPCGILIDGVPAVCVGDAHDGVEAVTVASFGARYEFRGKRFRPYVLAGLGVLRSTSVWSTATVTGNRVILTEQRVNDTGIGPDLGVGISFDLSPHLSIRPEFRWLDASVRSRLNLGVARAGTLIAYRW